MPHMPVPFRVRSFTKMALIGLAIAVIASLFIWVLFFKSFSSGPQIQSVKPLESAPARGCSCACIDVYGRVLGDVLIGSEVNLYRVSSTEPAFVMAEIRSREPIDWAAVDAQKRFGFECLSPGAYAFMVPASSYNGSVGAPLPDQIECGNLSVEIAFQGGDGRYAVGGFSINQFCGKA